MNHRRRLQASLLSLSLNLVLEWIVVDVKEIVWERAATATNAFTSDTETKMSMTRFTGWVLREWHHGSSSLMGYRKSCWCWLSCHLDLTIVMMMLLLHVVDHALATTTTKGCWWSCARPQEWIAFRGLLSFMIIMILNQLYTHWDTDKGWGKPSSPGFFGIIQKRKDDDAEEIRGVCVWTVWWKQEGSWGRMNEREWKEGPPSGSAAWSLLLLLWYCSWEACLALRPVHFHSRSFSWVFGVAFWRCNLRGRRERDAIWWWRCGKKEDEKVKGKDNLLGRSSRISALF